MIKADASTLEWRVKLFLAQDKVGIREIIDKEDIHTNNQVAFGLPSRLVSKVFIYRLIFADAFGERGYSGPAWAYAHDSDFMGTSESPKFWEKVVERFFTKYEGVREHSLSCIRTAIKDGRITIPTGRFYPFTQKLKKGKLDWPRSEILNYPVQGFAADYMKQVRLLAWNRIRKLGYGDKCLFICTVHDDLQLDCSAIDNNPEIVYNVSQVLIKCFEDAPKLFEKNYGFKMEIPMTGEIKYGYSLYEPDMMKFNKDTFQEDWYNYADSNRSSQGITPSK